MKGGRESSRGDSSAVMEPLIINQILFKKGERLSEEKTGSVSWRRKKNLTVGELHSSLRKINCVTALLPAVQLLQASMDHFLL